MDVISILQWEDQIAVRNEVAFNADIWYSFLSLAYFINSRQLWVFLAVGLYLMSCSLVRVEMNFDNSKDSSEGCTLNSSKSSQGSCPYFLVLM